MGIERFSLSSRSTLSDGQLRAETRSAINRKTDDLIRKGSVEWPPGSGMLFPTDTEHQIDYTFIKNNRYCADCGGNGRHVECAGVGCQECSDGACPRCSGSGAGVVSFPRKEKGRGGSYYVFQTKTEYVNFYLSGFAVVNGILEFGKALKDGGDYDGVTYKALADMTRLELLDFSDPRV